MGQTTESLYIEAGEAEADGDFIAALRACTKILRRHADEDYARLKIAMVMAAMAKAQGRVRVGWNLEVRATSVAVAVAKLMLDRRRVLWAIAATRTLIELAPDHPGIDRLLDDAHDEMVRSPQSVGANDGPMTLRADAPPDLPLPTDDREVFETAASIAVRPCLEQPGLPEAIPLLSELSRRSFGDIVRQAAVRRLPADHVVIQQGERDASVFVLLHGEVAVSRVDGDRRVRLATLGAGTIFGEMALIHTRPRSATVRSTLPVDMIEITGEHVAVAAQTSPEIAAELERVAAQRILLRVFDGTLLFDSVPRSDRFALVQRMTFHGLAPGESVLEEGAEPTGLFLVASGTVSVTKTLGDGELLELERLGPGEFIGEIGLLNKVEATATVTAIERTTVFHLDLVAFDELMTTYDEACSHVQGIARARLHQTQTAINGEVDTASMVL